MFKFQMLASSLLLVCGFAHAETVLPICEGHFAVRYDANHMKANPRQTVIEMEANLSPVSGNLIIAVRLNNDKDAIQYSNAFTCNANLLCTSVGESFASVQLSKVNNQLKVENKGLIQLYNQDEHARTVLINNKGGDDVFLLNQLTTIGDCT
jgi:hypothetical protein